MQLRHPVVSIMTVQKTRHEVYNNKKPVEDTTVMSTNMSEGFMTPYNDNYNGCHYYKGRRVGHPVMIITVVAHIQTLECSFVRHLVLTTTLQYGLRWVKPVLRDLLPADV